MFVRWPQFAVLCFAAFVIAPGVSAAESKAPLADAAERQDRQGLQAQLDRRANVNAAQGDGMTTLHWAVQHDDLSGVETLIKAGADVKAANRYGVTPLSIACTNGNGKIVKLLLDAGADCNTALPGGETALMTAARTGKVELVKLLVARGADVNAKEHNGQTALMWAAAEGHVDVVNELIEAGADFRTPLKSGFTPFFFAVREGRIDVVRALLTAGIDVNAVMQSKKQANKDDEKGVSPLILAVTNAHYDLAVILLEAGADPNDERSGYTALHTITGVRKPDSGDEGAAPPIGSGKLSSLQFVRELVKRGANVNARLKHGPSGPGKLNHTGATPFLLAADTADAPLMKLLVELGADPLIPNADHCTPLMAAAGIGTMFPTEEAGTEDEALEAAQLALDLGGDINAVDDNGETAMHGAAYKNLPKMVTLLAAHGAKEVSWNHKNKYGWTPVTIARGHRHGNFKPSPETVEALKRVMSAEGFAASDDSARGADIYSNPK
jgi:uncharacterized protein